MAGSRGSGSALVGCLGKVQIYMAFSVLHVGLQQNKMLQHGWAVYVRVDKCLSLEEGRDWLVLRTSCRSMGCGSGNQEYKDCV